MASLERKDLTFEEWACLLQVHQGQGFLVPDAMRRKLILLDMIEGGQLPSVSVRGRAVIQNGLAEAADNIRNRKGPMRWRIGHIP